MEWEALFKVVQSWGPSAISSALVIVVVYLIKKVDRNGEEDKKRGEKFHDYLEAKIKELREGTTKVLDEHGRRLSCIELEYVRRVDFYKDLGGWRDEINRLFDKVSSLSSDLSRNITELWKDRRGQ